MEWQELESRYQEIMKLSSYVRDSRKANQTPRLLFVCTHNSRRSQIARAVAPLIYHRVCRMRNIDRLPFLQAFSGGSEVTRVHPNTVEALLRAGFLRSPADPAARNSEKKEAPLGHGTSDTQGANPLIALEDPEGHSLELFSKLIDHPANPGSGFAAIMVCSAADEACPVVAGADVRISLPFPDPGKKDDTGEAAEAYDATLESISRDLYFSFLMALD